MPGPRTLSTLALVSLLTACGSPASTDDGDSGDTTTGSTASGTASAGDASSGSTSIDGVSSGGTSPSATGGTSPSDTDPTAGSATGGGSSDCSYDGTAWSFVDELDMPRMRGVGSEDQTCNPVTTDTIALEVQLDVPGGHELQPEGSVRILLFESDPDVADAPADCVGGLCESLEGSSLVWSFDVPNDLPQLDYYISVDLDDGNGCILHEVDFVTFSPAQGTLVVPMTASDCI